MWSNVPLDVLINIIDYLDVSDIHNFVLTCKNWKTAVDRWLKVNEYFIHIAIDNYRSKFNNNIKTIRYLLNHPSNNLPLETWFQCLHQSYKGRGEWTIIDDLVIKFGKEPDFLIRMIRLIMETFKTLHHDDFLSLIVFDSKFTRKIHSQTQMDEIIRLLGMDDNIHWSDYASALRTFAKKNNLILKKELFTSHPHIKSCNLCFHNFYNKLPTYKEIYLQNKRRRFE